MKQMFFAVITALIMFALPSTVGGKKPIDKKAFIAQWANYEITTIQVGQNGTKFLKVWGYGKKVDKAIEQAKKNAVHACLFRGCPGASNAMNTPAIFKNQGNDQAAIDNFEYFYDFFETSGEYISFVNMTTDGVPSGQDRREVKGGYKVAIYVQVMYDNLRSKMKDDGILKNASAGFSY